MRIGKQKINVGESIFYFFYFISSCPYPLLGTSFLLLEILGVGIALK